MHRQSAAGVIEPTRPAWVTDAIEGRSGPAYDSGRAPFDLEQLVAEARMGVGLDDLGEDDWREALGILLDSAESDADLHVVGRWRFRENIVHLLRTRLKMVAAAAADPTIAAEVIAAPIVVTGSPRSGSSILHQLLAMDPTLRAPRGWEYWLPTPPPLDGDDQDPRIVMADRDLRLTPALAPQFDAIHEMSSQTTRECGAAMNVAFRSEDIDANYAVRTYSEWLRRADKTPSMRWHRRVLQHLQHRSSERTWVLKNPAFLGWLDDVVAAYPDVHLVITHRDPVPMLSSVTSLYIALHGAHSTRVDDERLAVDLLDRHRDLLDGLVDWVQSHPHVRLHHVEYSAFLSDPVGTIADIYGAIGRELTPATAQLMRDYLAAHPQGRGGGHHHSFDRLGLDEAAVRRSFERYQHTFGVATNV